MWTVTWLEAAGGSDAAAGESDAAAGGSHAAAAAAPAAGARPCRPQEEGAAYRPRDGPRPSQHTAKSLG